MNAVTNFSLTILTLNVLSKVDISTAFIWKISVQTSHNNEWSFIRYALRVRVQKAAQLIQRKVSASPSEVMLNIAASFDNRLLLSLAPLVTDTMFNKASVEMSMRKARFSWHFTVL